MSLLSGKQLLKPLSISGSLDVTGSITVIQGGVTASLFGTASYASSTAPTFHITTGSIEALVNVDPSSIFLIRSASTAYFNIADNGDTTITSDVVVVKNLTTQQPVLSISQSVVQFATHSLAPQDPTEAGTIWFTSSSLYVGLE